MRIEIGFPERYPVTNLKFLVAQKTVEKGDRHA